ncbi:uncharacterized protein [Periplaneta americana]|uniref:uncharacterized protein isoform X3 n=1 Tax=Periplaneta americana TaxID=6978 RepID=UPI0037E8D512
MDLIKMEPEYDSLDLQHDGTYKIEENISSSKEEDLSHPEMMGLKADHTYEIKSEIKVEDSPVPTSFAYVKCEVDDDLLDEDRVQQEEKVEVSLEEDEVLTERYP